MQKPKLVHPKTGELLLPLYVDKHGRERYPIMGASPDDPDDDDDDGDDDDDDPDATVKVGDRTFKVSELQTIMAREKRQGKNSGQKAALKALGFDSLEDATAFVEKHRTPAKPKKKDDDGDDDATARIVERETAAEERERKARARERRADLRAVLRDQGATGDDLDDALILLDRAVDAEYDEDDLDDAVAALKDRRPALFGATDEDEDEERPKPRPRAEIPAGRAGKKPKQSKVFGAGGLDRAKRRGWIKD